MRASFLLIFLREWRNMEKTLDIDGKKVRFKATGGTMLRYKMQFGREYLADCAELAKVKKSNSIADIDLTPFYRIIWVLAKTADPDIPELLEWLDSFEHFPVLDIIEQLNDVIGGNIKIDRKN